MVRIALDHRMSCSGLSRAAQPVEFVSEHSTVPVALGPIVQVPVAFPQEQQAAPALPARKHAAPYILLREQVSEAWSVS